MHKGVIFHLRGGGQVLGAENVITEIASNSEKYGYTSIIGIINDVRNTRTDFIDKLHENDIKTLEISCSGRFDIGCANTIKQIIIDNNISVLHAHGYKEDFYAILSNTSIPKMATNHLWKTNTLMLRLYRALDVLLLRRFDLVAGVSDEIIREMNGLGIRKTVKIANGIDVNKFHISPKSNSLLDEFGMRAEGLVFGMISSLTTEKNHALAINALSNIENTDSQLLIVGDGPQLANLQSLVNQLDLTSRVFFVGRKNNVAEILSAIDVFLLPSLMEGLPMALLEAMACGKAVIASRVGENANVITDKINGLLFDSGDLAELISAMNLLLGDAELVKQFGLQARKTVEADFSSSTMTRNYCNCYDKLLCMNQDSRK